MILNTNRQALLANNALWHRNNDLAKAATNLSTGTKVNKSGDDPTGMAISNKMKLQIKGLELADRNVNDAVSLLQTAEGSIGEIQNIVQRMRELAVQSSNDTLTEEDRKTIQQEIVQLSEEIDSISQRTEFNKRRLLNDDYDSFTFHTGADYRDNLTVSFKTLNSEVLGLNIKSNKMAGSKLGLDYTTVKGSQEALERCDNALDLISEYRSNIGANQNRLEKTSSALVIAGENTKAALSRVRDTDMAGEMADYTKNNVLVQAGISMLAQANQRPNQLLSLLQ
nr:flagellin [uncultured Tyzzerella sp.]